MAFNPWEPRTTLTHEVRSGTAFRTGFFGALGILAARWVACAGCLVICIVALIGVGIFLVPHGSSTASPSTTVATGGSATISISNPSLSGTMDEAAISCDTDTEGQPQIEAVGDLVGSVDEPVTVDVTAGGDAMSVSGGGYSWSAGDGTSATVTSFTADRGTTFDLTLPSTSTLAPMTISGEIVCP
jgi:hypothetical protein